MKKIVDLLREHPFFDGIEEEYLEFIGGCGEIVGYSAGDALAEEHAPAEHFFLIRQGRVAIETYVPGHGKVCLQTLQHGDIFGWSWLFPPHQWTFDARAVDRVRAIRLGGKCLREKCSRDTELGYELMRRFARIMTERLQATRMQLLDIYGHPSRPAGGQ
ncbi:cyclic nucleotide-binding domain-containing protein [Microbulbifer rhizosphaerae]|uniref:CRP-like cAMP-binding protein n=1 Tax=Microbulbifer rhizosphaerae TaxID=1562603 RepID=A0A7W4WAF5_9GAMM|nr:CRP-like cAMP-binding protein [Microbulbifer rhizosphaerae]